MAIAIGKVVEFRLYHSLSKEGLGNVVAIDDKGLIFDPWTQVEWTPTDDWKLVKVSSVDQWNQLSSSWVWDQERKALVDKTTHTKWSPSMLTILLLLLLASLPSPSYSQVVVQQVPTSAGLRVKVTSTVNTLVCTFDNIGGATVTIHINCRIPLGYVLIETTTPRFTPVPVLPPGTANPMGGAVGCFRDDNGNSIVWLLQQLTRGEVTYQITDNTGAVNVGTFTAATSVGNVIYQPVCSCCWAEDPMKIWIDFASNVWSPLIWGCPICWEGMV